MSETFGDQVEVTLIDKSDAFIFGFSKLDVMFGHATLESVLLPYKRFIKPGVRFLKETVTAKAVAASLIDRIRGSDPSGQYDGRGTCLLEIGGGEIGRVDVDFFAGPSPVGVYHEPSVELRADKDHFGSSRRARWFGL